jgi:hypothetical protein
VDVPVPVAVLDDVVLPVDEADGVVELEPVPVLVGVSVDDVLVVLVPVTLAVAVVVDDAVRVCVEEDDPELLPDGVIVAVMEAVPERLGDGDGVAVRLPLGDGRLFRQLASQRTAEMRCV